MTDKEQQIARLNEGGIALAGDELEEYLTSPDILTLEDVDRIGIPAGYKQCGKCKTVKKFHLFNRNSSTRNCCTGNCKECQRITAQVSYTKTKDSRDYKKYYAENKEMKRSHSKKYYANNREKLLAKQREYRQTEQGKESMNRSHNQRKKVMKARRGIPYTREIIIDRDSVFLGNEHPICCLCGELITNPAEIHMEHLVSIAIGGPDCFTNVGCAHQLCNLRKSKDARELTVEQVEAVEKRAEAYISAHPEIFPEFA